MGELLLLALLASGVALAVAWPLLDRNAGADDAQGAPDDAAAVRHGLALEALRDLEADRRAGSLDEVTYRAQRAEAEARALETLADPAAPETPSPVPSTGTIRPAVMLGVALAGLLAIGFVLPEPFGIAERTVADQPLADAIAAEQARQAEIAELRERVSADPTDAEALSELADAFLAGPSTEDKQRGAAALIVLLNLEPENASAYRRLITAYISAGDWTDARAALDSYASVAEADEPDIPFFRGLVALRADGDEDEAVRQFDRFLELAPHDPRAGMVLSLREQAAGSE